MDDTNHSKNWSLVINSKRKFGSNDLKTIRSYKDLLGLFVYRDFVSLYKQTILGPLWFFIQPLITTIIFTVIFGRIANIPTNGIPPTLFYMAGITIWNYFSECLLKTSDTFITNQNIFGKVYFPRLIVPLSIIISSLLKFGVQLLLFIIFYIYFLVKGAPIQINSVALLFPVLIVIMAGLGLGFGVLISSLTTKYRDLRFLIQFGVQLAMYATPIVYPLEVAGKYKSLILANPMTSVIETFKYGFLGRGDFSWFSLLYSFIFMLVLLVIGVRIFHRVEKSFIDNI